MFSNEEIVRICAHFKIECDLIGELIDTSKCSDDRRFNYQINDKYFLKISNAKVIDEKFLNDIQQLTQNYESIGVYCPKLYETIDGGLTLNIEKNGSKYICYVEEKSKYIFSENQESVDYEFKRHMLNHLGKLANRYSNINLSAIRSMWSIIELPPFNNHIDEKQENFDKLISCLHENELVTLAKKMSFRNKKSREKIKSYMTHLPRCVYQGDLNNSNILVDENGDFKGVIDFNMFGTEVNINCFLNESMYFLTEDDFEKLEHKEILSKIIRIQNELLASITLHYKLNDDELDIMKDYNKIIYTSFWPNTLLMIDLITRDEHKEKVIGLLEEICKN